MERERERGRERGEGTLMFERRTRYLSAAWWVVDPRMARTGEQGMALGREGEIGREGGRERERERERERDHGCCRCVRLGQEVAVAVCMARLGEQGSGLALRVGHRGHYPDV